jgi:asparagine synthase (glutamine-hydrolysing)
MCGLAGFITPSSSVVRERLTNAASLLQHRGPDGTGYFMDSGFAVVVARLAIVDRAGSAQPIFSPDRRWVLVGNGEIYNFQELRSSLAHSEAVFTTRGDLECALQLFIREGPQAFARLRGPFALALWSCGHRRLWLARDRWGERPLFYASAAAQFSFSSEIRVFGALEGSSSPIDGIALSAFIGLGRIPNGRSILAGIEPVQPGEVLEIDAATLEITRYRLTWGLQPLGTDPKDADTALVNERIDNAIDRTLNTERPAVIAFSGGVDSTAIVERSLTNSAVVRTVTVVPAGQECANRDRSRRIAAQLGLIHTEIEFEMPSVTAACECLANRLDGLASSPIAMHNDILHRVVAQTADVMIGGHGADEVFAGYMRYGALSGLSTFADLDVEEPIEPIRELQDLPFWPQFSWWPKMRNLASWLTCADKYLEPGIASSARNVLLNELLEVCQKAGPHPLDRIQLIDLVLLNAWQNFTLPDENAMSHSVEVRLPFVDHDLVDEVFRLHWTGRLAGGKLKSLLRRRLARNIEWQICAGRATGFDCGFDYDGWLFRCRSEIREVIRSGPVGSLQVLRNAVLSRLLTEDDFYCRETELVWRLFALSCWLSARRAIVRPEIVMATGPDAP